MLSLRTLALVVTTGAIAGCAVGPDYHRPDAPLTDRYQTQSAIKSSLAEQGNVTQAANLAVWWESFNDPLLSELVSRALAQNLDLAQASARMSQARRTWHSNRGAAALGQHQRTSRPRLPVG